MVPIALVESPGETASVSLERLFIDEARIPNEGAVGEDPHGRSTTADVDGQEVIECGTSHLLRYPHGFFGLLSVFEQ